NLIFEGLLDLDENLKFRGRLATNWRIYEEAYFYVNVDEILLNGKRSSPRVVKALLEEANLANIEAIEIVPPRVETEVITEKIYAEDKKEEERKVELEIRHPARIKLTLKEVDQDLFEKLEKTLKPGYFDNFRLQEFITVKTEDFKGRRKDYAARLLSVTEHNPVKIFNLRRGVRFHDGHPLEASDVEFTYESIMNTKNRSPRISDYEPVKSLDIIDAHTVKVTHKRLFSSAIYAWSMGIIPEHLLNQEALDREARSSGKEPATFSMRDSSFNRDRPIGVGPFKFKEWKSDQYIRFVRNDDYWEGPPHYKEYVYRVVPDVPTQELEFYAGAVDSYGAQAHQVARLKKDSRFQNFSGLSYGYTYIGYNM
ncbi:MAG: peptide ABC transporter substrate-binding protein, partial [Dehalococcoidia bacterium]|nr:peptide ABC transporter substrate-binding protein [Dehalococcoidia bacterium]